VDCNVVCLGFWRCAQGIKLPDLAIVVVKKLNVFSERCLNFMHPMNVKDTRVDVAVIVLQWWESELERLFLNS
jgi:hypothetical protein